MNSPCPRPKPLHHRAARLGFVAIFLLLAYLPANRAKGVDTTLLLVPENLGLEPTTWTLQAVDASRLPRGYVLESSPTLPATIGETTSASLHVVLEPPYFGRYTGDLLVTCRDLEGVDRVATLTLDAVSYDYEFGWIPGVTVTASSAYSVDNAADHIVDPTHLVEAPGRYVYGRRRAERVSGMETCWFSSPSKPIEEAWLLFNLGEIRPIGEMRVWNINAPYLTTLGMHEVLIETSLDGESWDALGQYALNQSAEGPGQPPSDIIDFGGRDAQYVRLSTLGGAGVGNYGNIYYVCLGSVRFYEPAPGFHLAPSSLDFGTLRLGDSVEGELIAGNDGAASTTLRVLEAAMQEPAAPFEVRAASPLPRNCAGGVGVNFTVRFEPDSVGDFQTDLRLLTSDGATTGGALVPVHGRAEFWEENFIEGVTATSSSRYGAGYKAVCAADGSGMTEMPDDGFHFGTKAALAESSRGAFTTWVSGTDDVDGAWIEFDLGRTHALNEMHIWNGNQNDNGDLSGRGLRHVIVETRSEFPGDAPWERFGGEGAVFELARASGAPDQPATNLAAGGAPPLELAGVLARYVRLTVAGEPGEGNWSADENTVALAEVRFYGVPAVEPPVTVYEESAPAGWSPRVPQESPWVIPGDSATTAGVGFDVSEDDDPAGRIIFGQWQLANDGVSTLFPLAVSEEDMAGRLFEARATFRNADAATADLCPGYRLCYVNMGFTHYGGVEIETHDTANAPSADGDFAVRALWTPPFGCLDMGDDGNLADWPANPGNDYRDYTVFFDLYHTQPGDHGLLSLEELVVQERAVPDAIAAEALYEDFSDWGVTTDAAGLFDDGVATVTAQSITLVSGAWDGDGPGRFVGAHAPSATDVGQLSGNLPHLSDRYARVAVHATSLNTETTPLVRTYLHAYRSELTPEDDYRYARNMRWFDIFGAIEGYAKLPTEYGGRGLIAPGQPNPGVPPDAEGAVLETWIYTHVSLDEANDYLLPEVSVLSLNRYVDGASGWEDDSGGVEIDEVRVQVFEAP